MSRTILLDAGPLGLVTNPKRSPQSLACAQWLQAHIASGARVILPEISDYEVRRELLRAQKAKGIERLDALAGLLQYLLASRFPRCWPSHTSLSRLAGGGIFR